MRAVRLSFLAVLLALVAAPSAGAQTTQSIDITLSSHLGRQKQVRVCGDLLPCGTTTIPGFGTATWRIIPLPGEVVTRGCGPASAVVFLDLTGGGGGLVVEVEGQICFPGNSQNAPGSLRSWGNPLTFAGTFTITGGTGVFAGASGSGTATLKAAGARIRARATGTLTLP